MRATKVNKERDLKARCAILRLSQLTLISNLKQQHPNDPNESRCSRTVTRTHSLHVLLFVVLSASHPHLNKPNVCWTQRHGTMLMAFMHMFALSAAGTWEVHRPCFHINASTLMAMDRLPPPYTVAGIIPDHFCTRHPIHPNRTGAAHAPHD